MYSLGNLNHAVIVVGKCILDSNYEIVFLLNIVSLNLICSCSDEDHTISIFNEVYYAVRYVKPNSKTKCAQN